MASLRQMRFFKFGAPMLALIVGGSFALKEFQDIKMQRRDEKYRKLSKDEALKILPHKEKSVTLEEAYSEINKNVDINTWENKRGPRPWEESTSGKH